MNGLTFAAHGFTHSSQCTQHGHSPTSPIGRCANGQNHNFVFVIRQRQLGNLDASVFIFLSLDRRVTVAVRSRLSFRRTTTVGETSVPTGRSRAAQVEARSTTSVRTRRGTSASSRITKYTRIRKDSVVVLRLRRSRRLDGFIARLSREVNGSTENAGINLHGISERVRRRAAD